MISRKYKNMKKNITRKVSKNFELICKNYANKYNSFEKDITQNEELNKKVHSKDFEKALIKAFHTPFSPSKFTPKNDYYNYNNKYY